MSAYVLLKAAKKDTDTACYCGDPMVRAIVWIRPQTNIQKRYDKTD